MRLFLLFLSLLSGAISVAVRPATVANDPFYDAPEDIESYSLGDIMKTRPPPAHLQTMYMNLGVKNAWQFLIRSEDSFGVPLPISSTIIEPYNADNTKILSYQFAQDSALKNCSASYALLKGQTEDPFYTQVEGIEMEWGLQKGWYVNIPDHEGPKGAFCVGPLGGKAALNSIRAALKTGNVTGIDVDAEVVMWGYSGGTIPTGWAASMQPHYAPELKKNLIGAAVGGWVVNVTATAEATEGTIFAGLVPSAIGGIVAEYPHLKKVIYEELSEISISLFEGVKKMCIVPSLIGFMGSHFFTGPNRWVKSGFSVLERPEVSKVIDEVSLGLNDNVTAPEIPFYIYHSKKDDVVPFKPALKAFEKLCKQGAGSIELHTMDRPNHLMGLIEGAASALQWIEGRFNGTQPAKGCQITLREKKYEPFGAAIPYKKLLQTMYNLAGEQKLGEGKETEASTEEMLSTIEEFINKKLKTIGF